MLKLVINLFGFSLLLSCGMIPENPEVLEGETHAEYYKNGKLKSVCQVKDKKRDGICKYYNEDGSLKGRTEFKLNKFHGKSISYYKNGKVKAEAYYLNHQKDGTWKYFYSNGKTRIIENYRYDELNGLKQKFYENGKLMMENEYLNGKPSIELKEYDEKGNLIDNKTEIEIEVIDNIALTNEYILKLSLSSKSQRVKYYQGKLTEGKFLPPLYNEIPSKYGVGTYKIYIYRGTTMMEKINLIAKKKTKLGHTQIITKTYNLAVSY